MLILDILYGVSRYAEDTQMSKACTRCGEVKELSELGLPNIIITSHIVSNA